MSLLLAAVEPYSSEARTALFFVITIGLVVGSVLIVRRVRDNELIVLGLIVAAAAIGYAMLSAGLPGTDIALPMIGTFGFAGTLMKIAVVLVLAGVAKSLFLAAPDDRLPPARP